MKNRILTFLMITGMVAVLVGCNQESVIKTNSTKVDIVNKYLETETIEDEKGNKILELTIEDIEINAENEEATNKINEDIKASNEKFEDFTKNDTAPFAKENLIASGTEDGSFTVERKFAYSYIDDRFVSLLMQEYSYLGGAHGSTICKGMNYDANTGEKLGIYDLFDESVSKEEIEELIFKNVLKQIEEKQKEDILFYDSYKEDMKIGFDERQFYMDEKVLNIVYQQYEIAPYAAGIFTFSIPIEELESLLKDEYKMNK